MLTRRFCPEFVKTEEKNTHVYTATFPLDHTYIDYCGFSFTNDQGIKALAAVIPKITFSHGVPETSGHLLNFKYALLGVRFKDDKSHNRTHLPLFVNRHVSLPAIFTVTIYVQQLLEAELKKLGVKLNSELFAAPELFVATSVASQTVQYTPSTQVTPISKVERIIPYLTMDETKEWSVKLKDFSMPSRAAQMWFYYENTNLTTTSCMFSKCELLFRGKVAHTYTSPVQLQFIDRDIHQLFSSNDLVRKPQMLFHTISFGTISKEELEECELKFTMHPQFFKDYTTQVNEGKDKLKEIKDAVIVFQFGFVLCN